MVVGSGMIATRFQEYKDDNRFVIFASGVSNSATKNTDAFDREKQLLVQAKKLNAGKRFIYFSTCSIYDESLIYSLYVQHKLQMESLVAKHTGGFTIFRVSNPIGFTENKHTLLNFFINAIKNKQPFTVFNPAERNLIDIDDMFAVCHSILQQNLFINAIVNIANPTNYSVLYIIKHIEAFLMREAVFTTINKQSVPKIDTSLIQPLFESLDIHFDSGYFGKMLKKYYPLS